LHIAAFGHIHLEDNLLPPLEGQLVARAFVLQALAATAVTLSPSRAGGDSRKLLPEEGWVA
jgi:hypothetical protein